MNEHEQQGRDAAELSDEEAAKTVPSSEEPPASPPDRTDLPADGDPDDFVEEEVPEADFEVNPDNDDTMDNFEEAEEPNDLSEVDKEFEE